MLKKKNNKWRNLHRLSVKIVTLLDMNMLINYSWFDFLNGLSSLVSFTLLGNIEKYSKANQMEK